MNLKSKQYFVFDVDDTLTDSRELNQGLFVRTFIPYLKMEVDKEKYLRELHTRSRGTSMLAQFSEAVNFLKLQIKPEHLVRENELLHVQYYTTASLFPGVNEFLKKLKKEGKDLYVCTNRRQKSLMKVLERNEVLEYFSEVISCDDAGYEKPQPNCLIGLIEKYKMDKEKVMFWGDSATDAEFARRAGVDFLIIDHYLNEKKFYERFSK